MKTIIACRECAKKLLGNGSLPTNSIRAHLGEYVLLPIGTSQPEPVKVSATIATQIATAVAEMLAPQSEAPNWRLH